MSRKRSGDGWPGTFGIAEELTGFTPGTRQHGALPDDASGRPLSMAWISDALLARTQQVWSKAYGRTVDVEEAVEILTNVKHLAEALMKAKQGGDGK